MDCTLRPMLPADKRALMVLLRRTPEFDPAEIPVAEELIDCYLESPGRDYDIAVCVAGDRLAGYICWGRTPLTSGTWDVYWMAVTRSRRRAGIGSRLLEYAEAEIRRASGRLLLIETSSKPDYLNTRRFYRRKGYKKVSTIRDFYAPGDHRIIFEKRF
ncbi:MAG: GNAT family N-acetyltransferase [Dehalococcoidia bacterium]|nr:GNAT family N-acetyltransferase [Dehalococcoidia bacterium]